VFDGRSRTFPSLAEIRLRCSSIVLAARIICAVAPSDVGRCPPMQPPRLSRPSSKPVSPAERRSSSVDSSSPRPNSSPISEPRRSAFAHQTGHCHGATAAFERRQPLQMAFAAKYSWKERCDDCISSGSACSSESSGSRSCATRSRTVCSASRIATGSPSTASRTRRERASSPYSARKGALRMPLDLTRTHATRRPSSSSTAHSPFLLTRVTVAKRPVCSPVSTCREREREGRHA
jgi:hypothetical protein